MASRAIESLVLALLAARNVPRLPLAVEFPSIGTSGLRITNWPKNVTIGGVEYIGSSRANKFAIVGEGFSENLDYETPASALKITNLNGWIIGLFNSDSFRGQLVTISILYVKTDGTLEVTGWRTTFACDADTGDDTVTLRLASSDACIGAETPNRTTQEWGCQADFRNEGCGYRGTISTCDKGYDTPNGCKVHWLDVVDPQTKQLVQQWKPYGGFLGNVDAQLVQGIYK